MNQNSASAVSSPLFTEEQAALYLTRSVSSLRRDRKNGSGPGFIRIGRRSIRYLKSELDRYILACTTTGSAEVERG
jgi:predicted DNA-binding transcriptional regulator AlpA